MTNLRGSPNSGPGILTVGFNNLEHINIYTERSIPCKGEGKVIPLQARCDPESG